MSDTVPPKQDDQLLDALTFPLHGVRLIEASAGTGKTYTLCNLYLRLLLGHGSEQSAHPEPLTVDQILMMTFTRAATAELQDRIRAKVHMARIAFQHPKKYVSDKFISTLCQSISEQDYPDKVYRLQLAEQQIDQAAIFTIHSFCQRALKQYTFESDQLFDSHFIKSDSHLLKQATTDFWRYHFYPVSYATAEIILNIWSGPEALMKDITKWHAYPELKPIIEKKHSIQWMMNAINRQIDRIAEFKKAFLADQDVILAQLTNLALNKASYKNIPQLVQIICKWCLSKQITPPPELEKLSTDTLKSKLKKNATLKKHPIFDQCQTIIDETINIKGILTFHALSDVTRRLKKIKAKERVISNNDLLSNLAHALTCGANRHELAKALRTQYPVAMIDEFQDTDSLQYRIFTHIYCQPTTKNDTSENILLKTVSGKKSGLFFIGDPKQAVYAFRGADIFTYIKAKQQTQHHYTLGTNWRSSANMVKAVNLLFNNYHNAFIYSNDIPFHPVKSASKAEHKAVIFKGNKVAALQFFQYENCIKTVGSYMSIMSEATVATIELWLQAARSGQCLLQSHSNQKSIEPSDLTVLVRSRAEAAIIKTALEKRQIPCVFLSERGSVFDTREAEDMHYLLSACLQPEHSSKLRTALAVSLLNMTASDLERLNEDEHLWEYRVEQFCHYQQIWRSQGISPMLCHLVSDFNLGERLLKLTTGERALTNIFHLMDLLSQAAKDLEGPFALLRWLGQQLEFRENEDDDDQCLRLESDQNKVQIVTMHKSKGLEYPVVFLPFAIRPPSSKQKDPFPFFHDDNLNPCLDLQQEASESWKKDQEEKLAENLRLLYVAITRSIYCCFVGIAPIGGCTNKNPCTSLHTNSLGFLLQKSKPQTSEQFFKIMAEFKTSAPHGVINIQQPTQYQSLLIPKIESDQSFAACQPTRTYDDRWRVSSYSQLSHPTHSHVPHQQTDESTVNTESITIKEETKILSIMDFEKGARAGTFLHSLFENISFNQLDDQQLQTVITSQMIKHGWDQKNDIQTWQPVLSEFIHTVLHTELITGLTLSALTDSQRYVEMEFHLPIAQMKAELINQIIRKHDPLSAQAAPLDFFNTHGLLKGFIDLTFEHQGKFYILDYKSNFLGNTPDNYTQDAMEQAMISHRYDFQYQLYTLALHRLLQNRLPSYNYETHIGGVFYLFLRGMQVGDSNGIFFHKPQQIMIDTMDQHIQTG